MNTTSLTPLRIGILNGDDIGHEIVPATVEISRAAAALHGVAIEWSPLPIGRIALAAYELARQRRKHLTYVHKDTVCKLSCGMFVEECKKLAPEYPDVVVDDVIVDTFAMRLVRDPQTFDVVVTTNMFGDILSDEAAGLVGGLGMAPGLCIGDGNVAMAQATHGSAPDIAGKGIANPYAMMESARMMFDWLGHSGSNDGALRMAASMSRAITEALGDADARTGDIRGRGNTRTMTQAVLRSLRA